MDWVEYLVPMGGMDSQAGATPVVVAMAVVAIPVAAIQGVATEAAATQEVVSQAAAIQVASPVGGTPGAAD